MFLTVVPGQGNDDDFPVMSVLQRSDAVVQGTHSDERIETLQHHQLGVAGEGTSTALNLVRA